MDTGAAGPTSSEFLPALADANAVTSGHLEIASVLRYKLDQLMADERVGAGPQGRRSRSLLDLATTLEKLQRVERRALAMDEPGVPAHQQVIIVVPHKLSEDEWTKRVHAKCLDSAE